MRCRIYQRKLSISLAAGKGLSRRLRRHLAGCERCRAVHEELTALGRGLRAAAGEAEPALPGALRGRIVEALRAEGAARPVPARVIPLRLIAAVAAAACVLVALGLLVMVWPMGPDEPPVVIRDAKPKPRWVAPPGPEDLTDALLADVAALTSLPMVDEMRRLADDTRQMGSAMFACVPTELIRGSDGQWLDALLPVLTGSGEPEPTPTSRPDAGRG